MGSSNASVLVSGNRLAYRLPDDKTGQVLITELEYAYAVVNRLGQPRLMLFDGQQHHLPTDLPGFSQAYQELTRQLGFDNHAFFQATTERTPGKQEIWRKPRTPTYQLLPGAWDDYAQGFEVQSPRKQMISWDTPREELRIQNVLPAKGPGGGYLSVALRGAPDKAYAVMKGKCRVFDRYAAQLQRLTGRPLRFAPEWHDC